MLGIGFEPWWWILFYFFYLATILEGTHFRFRSLQPHTLAIIRRFVMLLSNNLVGVSGNGNMFFSKMATKITTVQGIYFSFATFPTPLTSRLTLPLKRQVNMLTRHAACVAKGRGKVLASGEIVSCTGST
jgi:hypothetical protein